MKYILFLLISFSIFANKNYILIGPPGSGKGTFSSYMVEKAGYKQICPGDIVRTHIKNETELGKLIKPIVERGDYIDDQIIYNIIETEVVNCIINNIPFIIDGFPRHTLGLEFIIDLFKSNNISKSINFVHFMIDDQTCIDRIINRLVCFNCYAVYNLSTKQPKQNLICDKCGNNLEIRLGDSTEITKKRLLFYRNTIEPLSDLAKKNFSVIDFYAKMALEDCIKFYDKLLLNHK